MHTESSPPEVATPAPAWQRKTLTVLFTDICGSTQLSRQMEMEDYGELFARIEAVWQEAAQRYHGLVSRMQGDGAMVLFGHPRAGERDVVNAVDAALYIHAELARAGLPRLQARSGVHTGVALVRSGNAAQGLLNIMGEAPNIAGTLEKLARPGDILVTTGSLKPHDSLFVLESRHLPMVKDDLAEHGAGPTAVAHVVSRADSTHRFEGTAMRGLTPLITCPALPALQDFMNATSMDGERVAVVTASAGMGKTRLLHEVMESAAAAGWRVLSGLCVGYRQAEPLQPFVEMLHGALLASDTAGRAAAEAALARPSPESLRDALAAMTAARRLLLIVDDWQWADDASRRLLQALLDIPQGPRLLLAARPAADGGSCMPAGLQLRIEPWELAQTARAVEHLLGSSDPLLVSKLHQYAGGVPLLVEELCNSTSALRLWQQLEGRGTSPDAGLKLLVASRMDQLAPELGLVVQAAAVVGNELPEWLLQEVLGAALDEDQRQALADADFLYPSAHAGALRFKHGLTRDAVYEHVSLSLRQALHRRARRALQAHQTERTAPGVLAYHCAGAGDFADAARFAELAGHEALAAFSMDLARNHYRQAMHALEQLQPMGSQQRLQWCDLACRFAMASIFDPLALGNDASLLERAVAMATQEGDLARQAECTHWLAYLLYGFGRFDEAAGRARLALRLAEQAGHAPLASQVEASLGEILVGACAYDEAIARIDAALEAKRRRAAGGRGRGLPIGSCYALACKGSALADRGAFADAQGCFDEALALLGDSMHPMGSSVRDWITVACIWQGRWEEARHIAADSVRLAENTGALYLVAISRATQGFVDWCASGDAEGLKRMGDAVRWIAGRKGRMFTSLIFGWLAEALMAEGQWEQARPLVAHVLGRARQGERMGEAIVCRAMAILSAHDANPKGVERWMARAVHSSSVRGSAREAALNRMAHGRALQMLGGDGGALLDAGRQALDAMQVTLPVRSLLNAGR
ncbi:AAA family ATPase [Pseudorhodoferax sp. Leaf267]|uniref:ATP-binding protein n=1 Tax=Pseudorhodoferax sp. Leaf267 TaxID=1736316 RepID=UPI0006F76997|nr:adenylate/guanylate cyclase domain-containing protein [Pseudorhodoferax sp. Leaf267]KQP12640.1 hypothetical protein ASF43_20590 [Pseudorhodoferax sp. Leaf267]